MGMRPTRGGKLIAPGHWTWLVSPAPLLLLTLLPAIPTRAVAQTNLDFELPTRTNSKGYDTVGATSPPALITDWFVTANSVDHGTTPAGIPLGPGTACASGQCIDLNGDDAGTIEQGFRTIAGECYTVTFLMSHHFNAPFLPPPQNQERGGTLVALIDGNVVASFSHGGPNEAAGIWTLKSFAFTASAFTVLAFRSTTIAKCPGGKQASCGPQIDTVTIRPGCGRLKVCKVAGPGVAAGTEFIFNAGSSQPFTVAAGPAPSGLCRLGPVFPVGETVVVTEVVPASTIVSAITIAPPDRLEGTANPAGGSVSVMIGSGTTEVTFTNERTSGFLEICKNPLPSIPGIAPPTPTFTYTIEPGNLGPIAVPAGSCSPAIEVDAGMVTIQETPAPGTILIGCAAIPAANQQNCDLASGKSTVTVMAGDVSTQTIAFFTNRRQ